MTALARSFPRLVLPAGAAAALLLAVTLLPARGQNPPPPAQPQPGTPNQTGDKKPVTLQPINQPPPVKQAMPQMPEPTVVLKPGEVPKIVFDTPTFDFGRVRAGTEIIHDFWFTNTGTGPLELTAVRPACGCTTSGTYDRIVQPGESGRIPIKLSTGHYTGQMQKNVTVTTNCNDKDQSIILNLKGELWQAVAAMPMNSANFGRITAREAESPSAALSKTVTIVSNVDTPLNITDLRCTSPAFRIDQKVVEPGKKVDLIISIVPPLKTGSTYGTVDFQTGIPDQAKMSVPASVFVVPDVEVNPTQLSLESNRNAPVKRLLTIQNNGKDPIKLTSITPANPELKVVTQETVPGRTFQLTIEVPPTYAPAMGEAVTIETTSTSVPRVVVPISQRTSPVLSPAGMGPTPAIQPTMNPHAPAPGATTPAVKPANQPGH